MNWNPFRQVNHSPDALLIEQFHSLRTQIPLMYALMFINASFLAVATYGEVPREYSLAFPAILFVGVFARTAVWLKRYFEEPETWLIKKYLNSTIIAAGILSLGFGAWGSILLSEVPPAREPAIALYVFVGSISCCYCLQALPTAGRLVLLFGTTPITVRLSVSGDWYLLGIAITFILVSGLILQTLANSHTARISALKVRAETSNLIDALQRSEHHHRQSVELNPQIPWLGDGEGNVTEISSRWLALTGMNLEESLGTGWSKAVHPEDLQGATSRWKEAVASGNAKLADVRYRLRLADGSYRWHRARAWPSVNANGVIQAWYGSLEDIHDQLTAERAMRESEERYRLASRASNDIIWDIPLGQDRIEFSDAVSVMLGYPEALEGTSHQWWLERVHPDDRPKMGVRPEWLSDPTFDQWTQEFRVRTAGGKYLTVRSRGYVVRDQDGTAIRLVGSLQDVTSQRQFEHELRQAAYFDALTNLPNRTLFVERLTVALDDAQLRGAQVGLAILDVDNFKVINDSLGHDVGDAVLREVANRLRQAASSEATVARLSGDEFAIVLPKLSADAQAAGEIETLLEEISRPMPLAGRQIDVRLSAGFAIAFDDGSTSDELRKSADLALYAAKRDHQGRLRTFTPELRQTAERELHMLSEARAALQGDWIVPYYQPKVCLQTGMILGFEALLRWHHPQHGLSTPASISAAFDDPSLATQLTDRMLERATSDVRSWRENMVPVGRIAINGSPEDFRRGDFAERILQRLEHAGVPPSALELEVTETVFLGHLAEHVSDALSTLSGCGVTIALDDFGTGYASLTHLKQFPVDVIKIDRSFVSRLEEPESENAAIVGALIELARNLKITTVAEGVETPAQAAHLIRQGCNAAQGYLFCRPIAASQVQDFVRTWSPDQALRYR